MARRLPSRLRRGELFTDSQYHSIALSMGQFILTWNDLHEKLAFVFTAILSYHDRKRIPKKQRPEYELQELQRLAGIWSSSLYDRPKREMLRSLMFPLVTADFIQFWTFEEDINWLLGEADKIEEIRNGAV